jgi:aryl-alcohol dehydrogenase-like predicted oxidoreductase
MWSHGDMATIASTGATEPGKSRNERALEKLRLEHLNSEEKKSLQNICFDYQDVFFYQATN